ncbi:TPA: hypothetical protein EYP38_04995, partial [Candidatus Micrarchaeota archaeon]|nr:hypothetical protein [Candidatus Micrarchaeota archaeon]
MEKKEPKSQEEMDLKPFKKPLHVLAALIGGGGVIIALVLVFIVNDTVDRLQTSTLANLDAAQGTLDELEAMMATTEGELESMEGNLDTIDSSMDTLADGVD